MSVIKVGVGHSTDAEAAISMALQSVPKPDVIFCFVSIALDIHQIYDTIRNQAGDDVPIIGGSSAGELSHLFDEPQSGSVVILALQSAYFSVGVGAGESLASRPIKAAQQAIREAQGSLVSNPAVMSLMAIALDSKGASEVSRIKPCVNIVLPDGCSSQEEAFLRALLLETGTVAQVIGGSTAGNGIEAQSYQICNGVKTDTAVVASFSTAIKMGTAMGHPYLPAGQGAVVTQSEGRNVKTLNGKPVKEVLSNLMGEGELTPELFVQHPFGIKSSDVFGEYTIKSAQTLNSDGSVSFFAEIPVGAFLRAMKTDKTIAEQQFRETLEKAIVDAGSPKKIAAVIVFNCILRHQLKSRLGVNDLKIIKEVCGEDVPMIGFNTFGEQGHTQGGSVGHYNQTATVLIIADEIITQ
jgi:hypothetical protein